MTVSYWHALPVRYMLVGPFTKHTTMCLECLAPYTPVKLVREITP